MIGYVNTRNLLEDEYVVVSCRVFQIVVVLKHAQAFEESKGAHLRGKTPEGAMGRIGEDNNRTRRRLLACRQSVPAEVDAHNILA